MKQYLMLILLGSLTISAIFAVSCSTTVPTSPPTSTSTPEPTDTAATSDSQKSVAQAPKIYEKNIPHTITIPSPGMIFRTPGEELKFRAETGNRVEGEVIVNEFYLKTETFAGNPYHFSQGFVFDPYRNVIVRSDCLIQGGRGVIRQYPKGTAPLHWQFAFVVATTGEYEVQAFIECTKYELITNPPSVVGTIRVTVYNK